MTTARPTAAIATDQHHRVVEEAIPLLAMAGIRGATLRDVAGRCGMSAANIAHLFGNKDRLIAACFAEVVRRDAARLEALATECRAIQAPGELVPSILWILCDEAGGARRTEMLVLAELLLSAPTSPQLAELCRQWLTARRDVCRQIARDHGLDPLAVDILNLHIISESCFAVSCAPWASYRLLAQAGFIEAAARLTGQGDVSTAPGIIALADQFFADPEDAKQIGPAEAEGRGAQSRARILDAAAAIIEAEGLAAVTNRAVADRAGVSLALTTYHYKSITALAFAGILHVFATVNASLRTTDTGSSLATGDAADRLRSRLQPSSVERLSRGMVEISLAAARGQADATLGLAIRQQRGTITYAGLRPQMRAQVTRTRAASYALWSSAAFLAAAALKDADAMFDFEAQGEFAAERLLGEA